MCKNRNEWLVPHPGVPNFYDSIFTGGGEPVINQRMVPHTSHRRNVSVGNIPWVLLVRQTKFRAKKKFLYRLLFFVETEELDRPIVTTYEHILGVEWTGVQGVDEAFGSAERKYWRLFLLETPHF